MDLDLDTVDRLLTTTRAVRKRLDVTRSVPRDVVTECIRIATQAPTAADAQNWRWVGIIDAERRRAIADVYRADNEDYVRGEVERSGPGAEQRRFASALHLIEHLHEVPVQVLAYVLEPDLAGLAGQPLPPAVLYGSIFPAVWSFQLALRPRGLGTTPLAVVDESAVAGVVDAPANARLAALLPIAYYTGETFKPAKRRPVEDVLSWDEWGSSGA